MIYRELSAEEFNDLASRILYEDNHLLVVPSRVRSSWGFRIVWTAL